jgi:protein TonB
MVSLLSSPQTTPQKSKPPANLKQKVQRTVTPETIEKTLIKKRAKPTPAVRKMPASKPIVAPSQPTRHEATSPVEQPSTPVAEASSQSIATAAATTFNKSATDAPGDQSPSFSAAYLDNPAPDYPSLSRRLGEQGNVLLRVQVTTNGAAGSVALQTSSGSIRRHWKPSKNGDLSLPNVVDKRLAHR